MVAVVDRGLRSMREQKIEVLYSVLITRRSNP